MNGQLFLIPASIGNCEVNKVIPEYVTDVINSLKFFIVENERTARRYLLKAGFRGQIDDLTFFLIDKHSDRKQYRSYLSPAQLGKNIGVLSEAGAPAVADPGADIVAIAHELNIKVVPLVGPSSILLALMASGLNGQNFSFHGYLPVKGNARTKKIRALESLSLHNNQTQVFIEAPYRNNQLLKDIISACHSTTRLCVAADITSSTEFIKTKKVSDWKGNLPDLHKRPAIFLLQAVKR